ncbi:hypothetical protein [Suilimivivens sp.]|uniref:hypothetical protein n=1 Tax=Suilimivivens sp. TaxID=2981669 RepID=UPI00307AB526
MPSKKVMYECKYCGKEFADYDECANHENTHICRYDSVDNKKIAEELRQLSDKAYGYHIRNMVMGVPVSNFSNLMNEAASRLEKQTSKKSD